MRHYTKVVGVVDVQYPCDKGVSQKGDANVTVVMGDDFKMVRHGIRFDSLLSFYQLS